MRVGGKYSYSKYRNNDLRPQGSGRVFVAPKIKFSFNPVVNLPNKFWGNLFLIIIILIIFWLLFYSRFFRIREIIVEGSNLVPTESIIKNVRTGDNIFRFDSKKAKSDIIKSNPIIADVEIYRGIPNALKIVVLERAPEIVWQTTGKFYLVDDNGMIDKEISAEEHKDLIHIVDQKNLPVKVGDKIITAGFVDFAKEINQKFFDSTNIKVSNLQVSETTFDLFVYTEAGFYVKFDTQRPVDTQLENLKKIIITYRDNIKEYVDVRINGWAYYK